MPYKDTSSDWFFFARSDLEAADRLYEEKLYHLVCFHAHQAIEKVLKGLLVRSAAHIPKTHDLSMLLQKVHAIISFPLTSRQDIEFVNRFYIPTRYPDTFPGALPEGLPTESDAAKARSIAQSILQEFDKTVRIKK